MPTSIAPCNQHRNPLVIPQGPTTLPEAPVSLNAYVETALLGRVQITGRGQTEREAVQHLVLAAEELRQQTQPQGPAPDPKPTLASLLACGLERAAQTQDAQLVDRLSKAAYLVLMGAVEKGNAPQQWAVRSQHDSLHWYDVTTFSYSCTCPAWEHAARAGQPKPCKHVLAACMYEKLN